MGKENNNDITLVVKGCKKGDPKSIESLYNQYSPMLMRVCQHYTGSYDTARDLLHDSFLAILDSISRLKDPYKLEPWMRSIVRNTYLRRERKEIKNQPLKDDLCEEIEAEKTAAPSYGELMSMIDSLPGQYGRVFKMSVVEGMTHREIAEKLNIHEHSSSSDLSRAKKSLYQMIKKYWALLPILLALIIIPVLYNRYDFLPQEHAVLPSQINEIIQEDSIPSQAAGNEHPSRFTIGEPKQFVEMDSSSHKNNSLAIDTVHIDSLDRKPQRDSSDMRKPNNPIRGFDYSTESWLMKERRKNKRVFNFRLFIDTGWSIGNQKVSHNIPTEVPGNPGEKGSEGEEQEVASRWYSAPVTVSLWANVPISDRWGLLTGVEYTYLASYLGDYHYLGIPAGITYIAFEARQLRFSLEAGAEVEIPIIEQHQNNRAQYSFFVGSSVEYQIGRRLSLFIEPRLQYYFNEDRDPGTIRGVLPLQPGIPIGIKYQW